MSSVTSEGEGCDKGLPCGEDSGREEQYASLLQILGAAVIVTDRETCVREANSWCADLTKRSRQEMYGASLLEWIHPDDREGVRRQVAALDTDAPLHCAFRLVRPDESILHIDCRAGVVREGVLQFVLRDEAERLERERKLQRRNREAVALYEIGRQVSGSFDVDQVLKLIAKNTGWLLESQFAGLMLFEPPPAPMDWRVAIGGKPDGAAMTGFMHVRGIFREVAADKAPLIIVDAPTGTDGDPAQRLSAIGLQSLLVVPLMRQDEVAGLLVCGFRERRDISEDEVRLVSLLGNHASSSLENARLYQAAMENAKKLKALTSRLSIVQEEERGKIARELHDGIGQALTAIRLNLDLLSREAPITGGASLERVEGTRAIIDETMREIHQLAFDLRPMALDDFGLTAALRLYVERFRKHTGINIQLAGAEDFGRWDPKVEATLYRVVQEALTNVAKHAGASQVRLLLAKDTQGLSLDIADDGQGFAAYPAPGDLHSAEGLGILNMKERIAELRGRFELKSAEGHGTHIHIEIPTSL